MKVEELELRELSSEKTRNNWKLRFPFRIYQNN